MQVTKDILKQYGDLVAEQKEIQDKIHRLERHIPELENQIEELETMTVKDRVYGGEGGIQGFNIEGFPAQEYKDKRDNLLRDKLRLEERRTKLKYVRIQIAEKTNEVEDFIYSLNDSHIRRIISLRFVEQLQWDEVAARIGGGNTEDSVRMAFNRFMDKD